MYLTTLIFIILVIIWLICLFSGIKMDQLKKESINAKYKIIKYTLCFILMTISIITHFILTYIKIPHSMIIDIVQMLILIPISIILIYTNKRNKTN